MLIVVVVAALVVMAFVLGHVHGAYSVGTLVDDLKKELLKIKAKL